MQELRLVAVSEDGTYLVLATAGRGTRFTLPVDDRLRAAVRGHFSRLGQFEIEVESPLRPKEIQARIRSGETAEEIAESAGIPVERVRWFEGPVLQEREYMAQQAQRVAVRRPGESAPGPPLGETVEERLGRGGVDLDEVEWDSWKCEDGTWRVRLSFFDDGRPHAAEWTFDPRRRHVFPLDEIAARLTAVEWDDDALSDTVTPLVPRRPAMKVVSSDRDPAARGLPGEPGAHGRLRPAEPREYPAEPPRMAEPRPFRETSPEGGGIGRAPAQSTTEPGRFQDAPRRRGTAPIREAGEARTAHIRETAETDRFTDKTQAPEDVREESGFDTLTDDRETPATAEVRTTGRDASEEREAAMQAEAPEAETERGTTQTREDDEPRDTAEADVVETDLAEDEAEEQDTADTRETGRSEDEAEDEDDEVTRPGEANETHAPETDPAPETTDDRETADAGETAAAERLADASPDRETAEAQTTGRDTSEERAGETEPADTARTDESPAAPDERAASRLAETPARRAARLRAAAEAAEAEAVEAEAVEAEEAEAEEASADVAAPEPEAAAPARKSGPGGEEKPARESKPAAQRPGQRQPARTPAKKKPAARPTMPAAQDKPATPAPAAAANSEPAAQRPARRRKAKGKRASVPSWDEIMFGARRPE
ncbi:septation protein SepH [Actinomadura livida]|uniref:DUF3071 domain-containing protein n=1 Tax=Actinomadura livida TaxID=79909 RepID=A0A7W7IBT1_9ACTN|nr:MULTISPECIES: septation protein SepH [Actinomadura]MBB4774044.1 hypothetical protein [Actinomadura catellatispora]GGT85258.1 hypothetical protein GCM10010208_05150 [Actinomadura livida]